MDPISHTIETINSLQIDKYIHSEIAEIAFANQHLKKQQKLTSRN